MISIFSALALMGIGWGISSQCNVEVLFLPSMGWRDVAYASPIGLQGF
ncbi:MAG: hypothetical protein Q4G11_01880 [Gallicola sp.]|nr:hypothetical protein [Gallicola sp.]